jgi:hypothetical protein
MTLLISFLAKWYGKTVGRGGSFYFFFRRSLSSPFLPLNSSEWLLFFGFISRRVSKIHPCMYICTGCFNFHFGFLSEFDIKKTSFSINNSLYIYNTIYTTSFTVKRAKMWLPTANGVQVDAVCFRLHSSSVSRSLTIDKTLSVRVRVQL